MTNTSTEKLTETGAADASSRSASAPVICKFGGSSVSDAQHIKKIKDIIADDESRRFVVVSAPGRSADDQEKVTDHLLNIGTDGRHFWEQRKPIAPDQSRKAVIDKFTAIVDGLSIDEPSILEDLAEDLKTKLEGDEKLAFLGSRGEHYNAKLIAAYLRQCGLEADACLPEDFGLMVSDDLLDAKVLEQTYDNIATLKGHATIRVVPGFYGVTEDGRIALFSRGGSDLTGGELAYALDASTYENWTDVSGVFEVDPRIVPQARAIPRLTFKEIRLLASKGFNVFHFDAMLNCRKRKIPIHIRNTNAPQQPGTLILNERVPEEGVVGIARLDNVAYIYLEKDTLSEETGFTASLLAIFQEYGVRTYFYPTDRDDIAVLVNQDDLRGTINNVRRAIEKRLRPEAMEIEYNLTVITPLGLGLKGNSYPIITALNALGQEHIPIAMIDQSPSQLCFHIGVSQMISDEALHILYRALITDA